MRYFIIKNGLVPIDNYVFCGDETNVDAIVARWSSNHPNLTAVEVDRATYGATVIVAVQTQAQKDWIAFKTQQPTPTALQGIVYLAKYLGLE